MYIYKLKITKFNFIYNKNQYDNIKILIFSFDTRNLPYIELHKQNFKEYSKKWKNIDYEFIDECQENIYWCKIFIALHKLQTNKYDYIMWVDSDVIITDLDKSIQQILYHHNDTDIFISHDNISNNYKPINAGIFIIKNSHIGIEFLKKCIFQHKNDKCIQVNNNLSGLYSQRCYEQGTMGYFINEIYKKNTIILSPSIFSNSNICQKDALFLHHFKAGKTVQDIYNCFKNF